MAHHWFLSQVWVYVVSSQKVSQAFSNYRTYTGYPTYENLCFKFINLPTLFYYILTQ